MMSVAAAAAVAISGLDTIPDTGSSVTYRKAEPREDLRLQQRKGGDGFVLSQAGKAVVELAGTVELVLRLHRRGSHAAVGLLG